MTIRTVLWDYGDTLADQDWMLQAPPGRPDWGRAWVRVARGELEGPWFRGEVGAQEIARAMAAELGASVAECLEHMRQCCRRVRAFEGVLAVARACPLPQAIVTLNPDVFTHDVAPAQALDASFPVTVTSWQEGTLDKAELCDIALARLGRGGERDGALLIDNAVENVRAWRRVGGRGYLFRGEERFLRDLDGELACLVAR